MSFVLLTEIFEEPARLHSETIKDGSGNKKIKLGLNKFSLRNVVLNRDNVVLLREDRVIKNLHESDELKLGLSELQDFTRVYLSCSERTTSFITVVGNLTLIGQLMEGDGKNNS